MIIVLNKKFEHPENLTRVGEKEQWCVHQLSLTKILYVQQRCRSNREDSEAIMPIREDQSQESRESLVPVRSYVSIQTVVHVRDCGHEDFELVRRHSSDDIAYTTIVQEDLFVRCVKEPFWL